MEIKREVFRQVKDVLEKNAESYIMVAAGSDGCMARAAKGEFNKVLILMGGMLIELSRETGYPIEKIAVILGGLTIEMSNDLNKQGGKAMN